MGAAAEGSPACAREATRALCVGSVSTFHTPLDLGFQRVGLCCHLPTAHCLWITFLGPGIGGDTLVVIVLSLGLGHIVDIPG